MANTTAAEKKYKIRLPKTKEMADDVFVSVNDVPARYSLRKKVYTLAEDLVVAPEPDQSCFGETDDPAVVEAVIIPSLRMRSWSQR